MGCGASSSNKEGGKDGKKSKDHKVDDGESPTNSIRSTRSMISVSSTRNNRKATSSYQTPKAEAVLQRYGDDTSSQGSTGSEYSTTGRGRESSNQRRQLAEEFVFGDFQIDPADVKQQRLERINRAAPKQNGNGNAKGSSKFFNMNDFRVNVDEVGEHWEAPELEMDRGASLKQLTVDTLIGLSSRIKTIAVTPAGDQFICSATDDTSLSLRNVSDGKEVMAFSKGHTLPIVAVAFSRDGRDLATSSRDNFVVVWDVSSSVDRTDRKQLASLEHPSVAVSLCFTFNHRIVSGGQDKICRVWDAHKGVLLARFLGHTGLVVCLGSHPKRHFMASGGADRRLILWRSEPLKAEQTIVADDEDMVSPLQDDVDARFFRQLDKCSPLENEMDDDGCPGSATAVQMRQYAKLTGHEGVIISVHFSNDGQTLISNDDRVIRTWRLVLPSTELGSPYGGSPRGTPCNSARPTPRNSPDPEGALPSTLFNVDLTSPTMGIETKWVVPLDSLASPMEHESYATMYTPQHHDDVREMRRKQAKAAFHVDAELSDAELDTFIGRSKHSIPTAIAAASSIATQRLVFTVSALAPGSLGNDFLVIGCTNRAVYLLSLNTGEEVMSVTARSAVFALGAGTKGHCLLFGDIFGNVYRATLRSSGDH